MSIDGKTGNGSGPSSVPLPGLLGVPGGRLPRVSASSLVVFPDHRLRTSSLPVTVFGEELGRFAGALQEAMWALGGVGLAAVQVGVPLRVFVFGVGGVAGVAVNPVLFDRRGPHRPAEGCLSVPGLTSSPLRHREVSASWCAVDGSPRSARLTGLLAQVFEHEVDHLDGVLLSDSPRV